MNELVVARQLERSLTKSASSGADIRVSKIDMDNAISAVERNMKQGLERRMKRDHDPQSCSIRENDGLMRISSFHIDTKETQHESKVSINTDDCPTRKNSKEKNCKLKEDTILKLQNKYIFQTLKTYVS